jgi:hypothetical protein
MTFKEILGQAAGAPQGMGQEPVSFVNPHL